MPIAQETPEGTPGFYKNLVEKAWSTPNHQLNIVPSIHINAR